MDLRARAHDGEPTRIDDGIERGPSIRILEAGAVGRLQECTVETDALDDTAGRIGPVTQVTAAAGCQCLGPR